jgi:hypothetical protein
MEGNNNEENRLKMDGINESFNGEEKKLEERFFETVKQSYGISGSDDSEKKLKKFMELEYQYTEMGEYLHKLSLELGICTEEGVKLHKEFEAILEPVGFFVFGVDKIEHPFPPRDVYQIQVCRKLPIEIESNRCTLIGV